MFILDQYCPRKQTFNRGASRNTGIIFHFENSFVTVLSFITYLGDKQYVTILTGIYF